MLQIVTGIMLALIYVPSAGEAWNSLQTLNHNVALGWYIRALHGWGSNFMVAIVLIHMVQVFLFGAYKYPRELTWIVGVLPPARHSRHGFHRARFCDLIRTRIGVLESARRLQAAFP